MRRRRAAGPRWLWYRTTGVHGVQTAGTLPVAAVAMFAGETVSGVAGTRVEGVDIIVGGMRLDVHLQTTGAGAGGNPGNAYTVRLGVYVAESLVAGGSETRDPVLTAVTDAVVDWMDLWSIPLQNIPAVGATSFLSEQSPEYFRRLIKAKRRLRGDQNVMLVARATGVDGSLFPNTSTLSFRWWVSLAFRHSRPL